jgi:hypothetical protein
MTIECSFFKPMVFKHQVSIFGFGGSANHNNSLRAYLMDDAGAFLNFGTGAFVAPASATSIAMSKVGLAAGAELGIYLGDATFDPWDMSPRPTVRTHYSALYVSDALTSAVFPERHVDSEDVIFSPWLQGESVRKQVDDSVTPWREQWINGQGREVAAFELYDGITGDPLTGPAASSKQVVVDRRPL